MRFRLLTGAVFSVLALSALGPARACDDRISGDRIAGTSCRQPAAEPAPKAEAAPRAATPQAAATQRRADRRARREARREARRAERAARAVRAGTLAGQAGVSNRSSRKRVRSASRSAESVDSSTRGRRSSRRNRAAERAAAGDDDTQTSAVQGPTLPEATADSADSAILPGRKVVTIPIPNPALSSAAVAAPRETSAQAVGSSVLAMRPFDAGTNVGQASPEQPSEAAVWPLLSETDKVAPSTDTTMLRLAFIAFAGLLTLATAARMIIR